MISQKNGRLAALTLLLLSFCACRQPCKIIQNEMRPLALETEHLLDQAANQSTPISERVQLWSKVLDRLYKMRDLTEKTKEFANALGTDIEPVLLEEFDAQYGKSRTWGNHQDLTADKGGCIRWRIDGELKSSGCDYWFSHCGTTYHYKKYCIRSVSPANTSWYNGALNLAHALYFDIHGDSTRDGPYDERRMIRYLSGYELTQEKEKLQHLKKEIDRAESRVCPTTPAAI